MTLAGGDVLSDRYVLKKAEWTSPLGPVWLARDNVLDRAVYVQTLNENAPAATRRTFLKATSRIAQISHPNLLQMYDIGDDPPFAVFEHANGGRLADRLRAGPLPATDAARAALGLARGLEELHRRGQWHGALSPASVLFDEEGRAKILSVGAAEAAGDEAAREQPDGYRPPEADALPADADRYALAALTFHMLTGREPTADAERAPRRGIPAGIDPLLRRALGVDPGARPTLDEFVGALAPFARVMPREAKQPRMRGSDFGWLFPVALILAIAALAVTFGVTIVQNFADRNRSEPTQSPTTAPARPIDVADVSDFDPEGNGEEHPEQAGRAIDGDALTAWATLGYRSAKPADKSGVGLVFDLGDTTRARRIRVRTTLPGWKAEIRIADTQGRRATDYRTITSFTAGTDAAVALPSGTVTRYVLLWITEFVDDGGGSEFPFRAAVAEVEFFR